MYPQSFLNRDSFLNEAFLNRDFTVLWSMLLYVNQHPNYLCAVEQDTIDCEYLAYFEPLVQNWHKSLNLFHKNGSLMLILICLT